MKKQNNYRFFKNEKQWKTYIRNLIWESDLAAKRGLLNIYLNELKNEPGLGFNTCDKENLMYLSKKIMNNFELNVYEMYYVKTKVPKYWRQLMKIAKDKILAKEKKLADSNILVNDYVANYNCCEHGICCDYGICSECDGKGNMVACNEDS
jgi:hypothetical protein